MEQKGWRVEAQPIINQGDTSPGGAEGMRDLSRYRGMTAHEGVKGVWS